MIKNVLEILQWYAHDYVCKASNGIDKLKILGREKKEKRKEEINMKRRNVKRKEEKLWQKLTKTCTGF